MSCNLVLCLAYWESYRPMFARNVTAQLSLPGLSAPAALEPEVAP
jgi:hypothetical protein